MENKKIKLEDLKLESFLTEINNSKLVKVQGGNGAYGDSEGGCDTETVACPGGNSDLNCLSDDCETHDNCSENCSIDCETEACYTVNEC